MRDTTNSNDFYNWSTYYLERVQCNLPNENKFQGQRVSTMAQPPISEGGELAFHSHCHDTL
jgi:hypothetical protein